MNSSHFRPWGTLHWMCQHLPVKAWNFVGCVGSEDRSLTAWTELVNLGLIVENRFLKITDKPSRHSRTISERVSRRLRQLYERGVRQESIIELDLFCTHNDIIEAIDGFVEVFSGPIVLDISVFPKRFFFPIVRRLLKHAGDGKVDDVIITYTIPESYPDDADLAENFSDDWTHLPLFGSNDGPPAKQLVIGVGFQALGLPSYLRGDNTLEVKLLIPFPAPPTLCSRSWNLVRQIEQDGNSERFARFRASARDPSDTFDRLCYLQTVDKPIALAPFGPKPMSLGMCLFACISDSQVFYTQPTVYHPEYTRGVSMYRGCPEVLAYSVRLGGRNLYQQR
jgi:hypothetical protein